MTYHKQFSLKYIFIVYIILGCLFLFIADEIILSVFSDKNIVENKDNLHFVNELLFFILSLSFFYFIIRKRNKITTVHISDIKKTQKEYLDLFNNTHYLFSILNKDATYTYISPSSKFIFGVSSEFILGKQFFENIHPEDIDKAKKSFEEVLKKDKVVMNHYRVKDVNGNWLWIETILENKLNKPSIEGIIVNSRNITEALNERKHLKLLESVITNTRDAVLITEAQPFDEPGPKIIYVNEAFTKMTGYTSEEVIGKTPRILQGPKSDKEELAKLSKAIRNWESYEITTINYKKNGEEFWINFTVTPVVDENGWNTHWIAIERDVTEVMHFNEELLEAKEDAEENELKLKEAQKIAHLGSWYYDFKNNRSYWSEETYNIWQLDPKINPVSLEDFQEKIHPKDRSRFIDTLKYAINEAESYTLEIELIMPDNSYKTVNTIGKPVFDKNNELIAFEGTTQDITNLVSKEQDLKNALATIEKNQHSINQASKLAKVGFWEYEFETKKLIWSDYIYQLYNFDRENYVPNYEDSRNYFDSQSQQKIIEATKNMIETGEPYDLELRMFSTKNEEVWVRNVVQPVYDDQKKIVGKRGIVQNITEEKYLRDLNKEVARMVKIGSWNVDLEKETVFWSEEIHELHETDSKTFVPTLEKAINFYREDFREKVQSIIDNTIKTGLPFDFEAIIVTSKKKELWIRAIGNADFVNGKCVGLYGGFQDINEKKLAAIELEKSLKSLEDYRYSLDQSAIIAFTDQKGVITYANDNFCKISGYSREELIGNTHSMINSNYHPKSFFVDLWKTIKSGNVWRGEIKNKAKNGTYYWVDTTIVPFLNEKNRPNQYLAIRFDITERKNAAEEKIRFQRTLENSVNEIYMFNAQTLKFSYINKGALKNLGYTLEEAKKLTPLDLKEEFTFDSFHDLIQPLKKKEKEKIVFFTTHKRKDGSFYPVEVHLNLVEEDKYQTFVAIILDITERRKNAEEKNRFQTTLENSVNEIYIFDSETFKFSYVNKSALQNLGYTDSEIKEITPLDIKPEYTYESFNQLTNPLKNKNQDKIVFYTNHKRKDGSLYPVEIHLNLVEDKTFKSFIAIVLDISQRKKSEEKLFLASERLKLATSSVKMGIWDWNIEKDILIWDERMFKLYGIEDKNFTGTKEAWENSLHPDDVVKTTKSLNDALNGIKDFNTVFRIVLSDKSIRYIKGNGIVTRNADGDPIRMIGSNIDITEEKETQLEILKAKKQIEVSEAKFKSYTEKSPVAIYTTDEKGDCNYVNETWLNISGMTYKEALGKGWLAALHPDDLETIQQNWYKSVDSKGKWRFEYRFVNKINKEITWVEGTAKEMFNQKNELIGYLGTNVNITERKQAENMYKLLAENTNDIIALHDKDFKFKYISPALTHLLGYDVSEFLNKNFKEITHKDDYPKVKEAINTYILQGNIIEPITYRVFSKNGDIVWLESLISPIIMNDEITSFVATTRDITLWMNARKEIEDYQSSLQKLTREISIIEEKQKKEIAANIHDHLSQSLVISKMRITDLEKKDELKTIYPDLEFIKNHISNALENSRKITYELSPPIIYQLGIIDALDWFAEETKEKYKIDFTFTTNVDAIELSEFKSILVYRCVQEAVTNTLKYAEASLISLDVTKEEDKITITLIDDGNGFDTSILNTKVSSGSGFGLFAVKERIRNLNGKLEISSELHIGTTIKITIPL